MLESLSEKPRRVLKLAKIDGLFLGRGGRADGLVNGGREGDRPPAIKKLREAFAHETEEFDPPLVREAKPARRPLVGLWVAAAIVAGVAVVAAPLAVFHAPFRRPDLPRAAPPRGFLLETALWLATRSRPSRSPPGWPSPVFGGAGDARWALLPVSGLAAALLCAGRSQGRLGDGMDSPPGRMAPGHFMGWASSGGLLAWVVRRAAPTRLAAEGFWIAFGSGALISFVMQFVCPMENIAHSPLHSVPVALLALAGFFLGKKILRW